MENIILVRQLFILNLKFCNLFNLSWNEVLSSSKLSPSNIYGLYKNYNANQGVLQKHFKYGKKIIINGN